MNPLDRVLMDKPPREQVLNAVCFVSFIGFLRWKSRSRCFKVVKHDHLHKPQYRPRFVGVNVVHKVQYLNDKTVQNIDRACCLVYRLDIEEFKPQEYSKYQDTLNLTGQKISNITNLKEVEQVIQSFLGRGT